MLPRDVQGVDIQPPSSRFSKSIGHQHALGARLAHLGTNAPAPLAEALTPAVPIRRSVQPDHVVCLECGFRGQILRRHLRVAHGLEPAAYRARWKLPVDHPITAPVYSERRSTMAKDIGLGSKAQKAAVASPAPEVVAPPAPRRGRKTRSAVAM